MDKKKVLFDVGFLEEILNSAEVNGAWKDCLDTYEGLGNAEKIECLHVVIELRDHLIEILKDVSDAEERQVCMSLFYVRLKSEWMLLNTQYTYQMDAKRVRHRVICLAGLLSALLGAMEPYCLPDDIVRVEALLAQLPNGSEHSDNPAPAQEQDAELRCRLESLEKVLAQRETALTRLQEEWRTLEVGIGKTTAREIVETVRVLKDKVLELQRNGSSAPPERYQEFEREFGGLSARQINQHVQRLESKVRVLEEEARLWSEGQQLLLKEIGDTDPIRLVARVQDLQDQVTHLTIEAARSATAPLAQAPRTELSGSDDLSAMLGSLESALLELTSN